MGLDLFPAGRPKPGHEGRWAEMMQRLYDGERESKEESERRFEISILPWADVGAPRVGEDAAADAWLLAQPGRDPGKSDAQLLEEVRGYCVLALLRGSCDGIPSFTHAGRYDGIDETSFRGAFLQGCEDLVGKELITIAWTDCMRPEEAVEYGKELLEAAERAAAAGSAPAEPPARRWWSGQAKAEGTANELRGETRDPARRRPLVRLLGQPRPPDPGVVLAHHRCGHGGARSWTASTVGRARAAATASVFSLRVFAL